VQTNQTLCGLRVGIEGQSRSTSMHAHTHTIIANHFRGEWCTPGSFHDKRQAQLGSQFSAPHPDFDRDQRVALQWVRAHARAFGGNPHQVTIFGESAGGTSVITHVLTPGSAGLFDQGISESASAVTAISSINEADSCAAILSRRLCCANASDLPCWRAADAHEIVRVFSEEPGCAAHHQNPPTVDGRVYPAPALELIEQALFNRVPLILGTNRAEADAFVFPATRAATAAEARCALQQIFNTDAVEQLADVYEIQDNYDNRQGIANIITDWNYRCDNQQIAQGLSGKMDTWMYSFDRHPVCDIFPAPGAHHMAEVPFVFHNIQDLYDARLLNCNHTSSADEQLSQTMSKLWADFGRDGRPTAVWAERNYSIASVASDFVHKISLGTLKGFSFETGYRKAECRLLRSINSTIGFSLIPALVACQSSDHGSENQSSRR